MGTPYIGDCSRKAGTLQCVHICLIRQWTILLLASLFGNVTTYSEFHQRACNFFLAVFLPHLVHLMSND
jgi:hypothetical protein